MSSYATKRRNIRCFLSPLLFLLGYNQTITAQTITGGIKGSLIDSSGNKVPFVTIFLDGKPITATDSKGTFELKNVPAGTRQVAFSGIGIHAVQKEVVVQAGETVRLDVRLSERVATLDEVSITAFKPINGIGRIADIKEGVIYAGKKTEMLLMDSLNANTSQNIMRQVLGKIPGANVSETENTGLPSNGIGFRGLNPTQSTNLNLRQNGYNIAADPYGYSESYYIPPTEALERVEITRGAASLQFGPQFGGMVNYITRNGDPIKPLVVQTQQTMGNYGLFNSFNSIGGTYRKFSYYGYVQYRTLQGWRPNSAMNQTSGFGKITYQANDRLKIGLEYSILRNQLQMPGGLTDAQFNADPRQSVRSRNWLESPWNIAAATLEYKISPKTNLYFKSSYLWAQRNLVWMGSNPNVADSISSLTQTYQQRQVQSESFSNSTNELRLSTSYSLGGSQHNLAAGVRYYYGYMTRAGGPGSTGSDFNLNLFGPYAFDIQFTTINTAVFAENTFHLTDRFSITPGFRYELLKSTAQGYTDVAFPTQSNLRSFPLFGTGLQYKTNATTNIYANWSQAYSPITYAFLTPQSTVSSIDPNMKDSKGWNADLGWRGTVGNFLNFDVGGFMLAYNNRIGVVPDGNGGTIRTNTGSSLNTGVESYAELDLVKLFTQHSKVGILSIFNSLAYVHARYTSGQYNGNQVEYAPAWIERAGLTYSFKRFSATYQYSYQSSAFSDAANTPTSVNNPQIGLIPSYFVMDLSATYRFLGIYNIKCGANNLTNEHYFTTRTDEYPGPGIIPSTGRSIYVSFGAKF